MDIILEIELKAAIAHAEAEDFVTDAIKKAEGQVMILDEYAPYDDLTVKANRKQTKPILYCVYPSNRGGWTCYCLPEEGYSFARLKFLPEAGRGKTQEELREITGIKTMTFCHRDGFIACAETKEDAIAIARLAVKA